MGRTITTHLLEGTPKGVQSIQISNKTIMAFVLPRANLKKCTAIEELKSPCLYILLGEDNDTEKKIYVGQTEDFSNRVTDHNQNKDFWNKALVFISQAGTLNKADISYLEYLAFDLISQQGIYNTDENRQNPKKPKLQRHSIDTNNDFFEDIRFITEFSGYSIFKFSEKEEKGEMIFYARNKGNNADGFYNENGFTVLKGSEMSKDVTKSFKATEKRVKLIAKITEVKGSKLILKVNKTFPSPSAASEFCFGRSSNGWTDWKNKDGKTLHEIYRS